MATSISLSLSNRRHLSSLASKNDDELADKPYFTADPLTLSLLAGLSTCLGATVVFWSKQKKLGPSHMAFALSLAGSVMITVSVASILPECFQIEDEPSSSSSSSMYLGPSNWQFWARCLAFAIGCFLYLLLSRCAFPEPEEILGLEHQAQTSEVVRDLSTALKLKDELSLSLLKDSPNETDEERQYFRMKELESSPSLKPMSIPNNQTAVQRKTLSSSPSKTNLLGSASSYDDDDDCQDKSGKGSEARRAWRVTMLLFVSLAVHNFPEGLAVAASSLHSEKLGWTTTVAIALHNIPEGIAIAIPCMAARPDSPWLAFLLASLSGLAEPLGAAVAVFLLQGENAGEGWLDQADNMKNLLAFVAGVMIMVASIELYPEARRHMVNSKCPGVSGTLTGVFIMLSSDAYLDS